MPRNYLQKDILQDNILHISDSIEIEGVFWNHDGKPRHH